MTGLYVVTLICGVTVGYVAGFSGILLVCLGICLGLLAAYWREQQARPVPEVRRVGDDR